MSLLKNSSSKSKPKLTVAGASKKSSSFSSSKVGKKSSSRASAAKPRLSMPKVKASSGLKAGTKSPNTLAYTIPPVILACIFGYCATHTFTPEPKPEQPTVAAVSSPAAKASAPAELAVPADINNDLPSYAWAAPRVNMLTKALAKVNQSGASKTYAAENAIDGSTKNDARMAQAVAANGQTWWKADFINGTSTGAVSTLVIYGGGSASPVGKLKGGFEVQLEGIGGESFTRRFCEDGFALEGYEEWTLDVPTKLRSITITPLKDGGSLVLREVQAIGVN